MRERCSVTSWDFPLELRLSAGVLQVASPTPARVRIAARGCHPLGTRLDHRRRVGTNEGLRHFADGRAHELIRQRVTEEHDLAIVGTTHGAAGRGA